MSKDNSRHPELVSGSIVQASPVLTVGGPALSVALSSACSGRGAGWVLESKPCLHKRVQHDGGGTIALRSKPLLFRGGVGVGAVVLAQRPPAKPRPAATRQQAAKSRCPSPEEEGVRR